MYTGQNARVQRNWHRVPSSQGIHNQMHLHQCWHCIHHHHFVSSKHWKESAKNSALAVGNSKNVKKTSICPPKFCFLGTYWKTGQIYVISFYTYNILSVDFWRKTFFWYEVSQYDQFCFTIKALCGNVIKISTANKSAICKCFWLCF